MLIQKYFDIVPTNKLCRRMEELEILMNIEQLSIKSMSVSAKIRTKEGHF